jgi:hypothetical protein
MKRTADPAHDVLGYERLPLEAIFRPQTVAVIGASDRPGNVGRTIMGARDHGPRPPQLPRQHP